MVAVELWRREDFASREFPSVRPLCDVAKYQLGPPRTAVDRQLTVAESQSIGRMDTSATCARGTPPSLSLSSHLVSGSDEKPDRKMELIPEVSREYP